MAIIVPIEMPDCCFECPFMSRYVEACVDIENGFYKHIARCTFQPSAIEDGYEDTKWLAKNRFPWCPLKPVKD